MKNSEKYKTAFKQAEAFDKYCKSFGCCDKCPLRFRVDSTMRHQPACAFAWLELDYAPIIESCPFCGGECRTIEDKCGGHVVGCDNCCYCSRDFDSDSEAIEAHNRLVCAVKKGEAI